MFTRYEVSKSFSGLTYAYNFHVEKLVLFVLRRRLNCVHRCGAKMITHRALEAIEENFFKKRDSKRSEVLKNSDSLCLHSVKGKQYLNCLLYTSRCV